MRVRISKPPGCKHWQVYCPHPHFGGHKWFSGHYGNWAHAWAALKMHFHLSHEEEKEYDDTEE
jgi:hypothetical protein